MFGCAWGDDRAKVMARFSGVAAVEEPDRVIYPWSAISAQLVAQDGFVPTGLQGSDDRTQDELVFIFAGDGLAAINLNFGYGFERLGQDPDRLSDQAMAILARAEFAGLLHEMGARYGAPQILQEHPMRQGPLQAVGAAHYMRSDNTAIRLMFGHDGGALVGQMRYLAPASANIGV